jgi:hypothetical protein
MSLAATGRERQSNRISLPHKNGFLVGDKNPLAKFILSPPEKAFLRPRTGLRFWSQA